VGKVGKVGKVGEKLRKCGQSVGEWNEEHTVERAARSVKGNK
jgi:hypothetical protein